MAEKNILNETVQEKAKEKVESKSVNKPKQPQYKECEVLAYNAKKKTIIVSFNGFGYEFENIEKNPGKTVRVKPTGKIGSPSFKLALV